LQKGRTMIKIKRETIIKAGDTLVDTQNNQNWKVNKIDGYYFHLANEKGTEKVLSKFDLMIIPGLQLQPADDRGYY